MWLRIFNMGVFVSALIHIKADSRQLCQLSQLYTQGIKTPCLPRFRRALRGLTYKRSWKETRGRKAKLNHRLVLRMNATRTLLIKQAKGQREVR